VGGGGEAMTETLLPMASLIAGITDEAVRLDQNVTFET
jgi:hypothetical protein